MGMTFFEWIHHQKGILGFLLLVGIFIALQSGLNGFKKQTQTGPAQEIAASGASSKAQAPDVPDLSLEEIFELKSPEMK